MVSTKVFIATDAFLDVFYTIYLLTYFVLSIFHHIRCFLRNHFHTSVILNYRWDHSNESPSKKPLIPKTSRRRVSLLGRVLQKQSTLKPHSVQVLEVPEEYDNDDDQDPER